MGIYRLASPYENDSVFRLPDKSNAVMFNYLTNWRYVGDPGLRPIKLQGLDAGKNTGLPKSIYTAN